jgi:hypothetical protein
VLVDGVPYKRLLNGTETYHSLSGPLVVARDTYRKMGVRNGPTVVPMDLCAGIVEGGTPALAYNVAHGYAQHAPPRAPTRSAGPLGRAHARSAAAPWAGATTKPSSATILSGRALPKLLARPS